jgi:ribosomal-protein-alanine N-acetyltransferase
MRLRAFRPSDLETLHQIDQACFPPGVSYSCDELARFIAGWRAKTWVAEDRKRIVGFLVANRHTAMPFAHIVTVDVVEGWRRRGVGGALMDAAEKWARQVSLRGISLETAEDNFAARAFYAARGYAKHRRVKNYYANGRAAWVMVKRLE